MTEMLIGYGVSDRNLTVILKVNRPFIRRDTAFPLMYSKVWEKDEIDVRGMLNGMFEKKRFLVNDYPTHIMPKEGRRLWHELAKDRLYQHPLQILVYEGKPEQLPDLKTFGKSRKIPIEEAIDARVAYLIENFAFDRDLQKV